MFDEIVQAFVENAAPATATLLVTGAIAICAEIDRWVRDAGPDAPLWLRFLSRVVSHLGRNVGRAENEATAQLKRETSWDGVKGLALVLLVPAAMLTSGCRTTLEPDNMQMGYGMNEAYNVSGPNLKISADGAVVCTSDGETPCRAQTAAGWEAWENIFLALSVPFEAALQLVGRSLSPVPLPAPAPAPVVSQLPEIAPAPVPVYIVEPSDDSQ
jgi:hypothetical protein